MIGQDFVNIRHTRVEIIIGMRVMAILPKVQWSNFNNFKYRKDGVQIMLKSVLFTMWTCIGFTFIVMMTVMCLDSGGKVQRVVSMASGVE